MPFSSSRIRVFETVYCRSGGAVRKAVIYKPPSSEKGALSPAAVCVHGGAWVSGDRFAVSGFAEWLAGTGIPVMSIDTRLAPQYPYPAAASDVNCALRWLKYHAGDLGIDPAKVGTLGVSSGGFLVLAAALLPDLPEFMADAPEGVPPDAPVTAETGFLVTCSGVLDPLSRYKMAEAAGASDILLCHEAFFGTEEKMVALSPEKLLSRPDRIKNLPPALFFQGGMDPRVPAGTASKTAGAWRDAGGRAEAVVYEGEAHSAGTWVAASVKDMFFRIYALISSL